jgi:hypothetical protein
MTAYSDAEQRFDRPSTWPAIFGYFAELADLVAAARRTERLLDLSDAELSRQGLRREDVVSHVFRHHIRRG